MESKAQFYIFKEYLDNYENVNVGKINKLKESSNFSCNQIEEVKLAANIIREMHNLAKNNVEKYDYMLFDYNKILEKTYILARELKLSNSMEYTLLYTYLMQRGYFSKNKKLHKQLEGRKNIYGLFSLDIMGGNGVCLNFSELLKDLLNKSGFNSATIMSNDTYKNLIARKILVRNPRATHATNLIIENDKMYIYDSANECLLGLENTFYAKVISGESIFKYNLFYKYKLHPFTSYQLNYTTKDIKVLDTFNSMDKYISPYNKDSYDKIRKQCIEHFEQNRQLISDYYECTRENIHTISKRLELIKEQ